MANPSLGVDVNIRTNADTRSLDDLNAELNETEKKLRSLKMSDAGWNEQALKVQQLKGRIGELGGQLTPLANAQHGVARSSASMGKAMAGSVAGIQGMKAAGLGGIAEGIGGITAALGAGGGVPGLVLGFGMAVQQVAPVVAEWSRPGNGGVKLAN